jgi:hypothetical protein
VKSSYHQALVEVAFVVVRTCAGTPLLDLPSSLGAGKVFNRLSFFEQKTETDFRQNINH